MTNYLPYKAFYAKCGGRFVKVEQWGENKSVYDLKDASASLDPVILERGYRVATEEETEAINYFLKDREYRNRFPNCPGWITDSDMGKKEHSLNPRG